jgi:putative sterol carrier protein
MDLIKQTFGDGSAEKADVVFESSSATFVEMLEGTVKPSNAFLAQKLKIRGNITEALKLEKALKKLHNK